MNRLLTASISLLSALLLHPGELAAQGVETVGKATYYADKFNGRRTASGERFCQDSLTCAHKTLPFGTMVKVTNLTNHKSVVVRVNDRGPFKQPRIIDLSKSASAAIGGVKPGIVTVSLEGIDEPGGYSSDTAGSYAVQIGAFRELANLNRASDTLKKWGYSDLHIMEVASEKGTIYRLIVGPYGELSAAEENLSALRRRKYSGCVVSYR